MINNFYFVPSQGPLQAFGKIPVGRDQIFWEFSFKAYREAGGVRSMTVCSVSGLRVDVEVPPLKVESFADWRALLRATPGAIVDQQGGHYTLDEFEARVAESAPRMENGKPVLLNRFDEAKSDRYGRGVDRDAQWKDAEGFSFNLRGFG